MRYESIPTICSYCGCGCGVLLQVADDDLIGILPSASNRINQGSLCIKGWTQHEFVNHESRLRSPMMKKGDRQEATDWDTALDHVAGRLKAIRDESGPNSIAVLTSAKCTNEENYLMQKLARAVIGTNNVDHCARL